MQPRPSSKSSATRRCPSPHCIIIFTTRPACFRRWSSEALDQRLQVVQQAAARARDFRGQLVEILAGLFDYFHKNRDLTRIAFSAAFAAPGEVPHDVCYLDRCQRNLEFIHSLMKRARAAGELDKRFDSRDLAYGFYGQAHLYIVAHVLMPQLSSEPRRGGTHRGFVSVRRRHEERGKSKIMNEEKSAAAPNANGARLAKLNSPWLVWPAAIVLAGLLFFGLDYLVTALTHESTDDAFITAHVVSIAPRIAGQVSAIHALDNEMVHSNELLVEIDPSTYAITVAQKRAAAASQDANVKTVLAVDELMHKKVVTAQASARKAKADADASEATAKRAAADFERSRELRKDNTISQQEFDAAQATDTRAQADLKSAQENVDEENSKVDEAGTQLAAAEAEVGLAMSQWQEAQTNVASAQLDFSYTKIYAPSNGRVTRKAVEPGDYVQIGEQLMSLVPTDVWIVANFKESQLKKMKPGQRVKVEIDALGGRTFRAHVDSVQAGSGAAFSLLPPENATGNYVKVVQRVPVKILFDEPLPADHTFGPGLSVTPSVRVSRFEIPAWVIGLAALALAFAAGSVFRFVLNRKTNSNGK